MSNQHLSTATGVSPDQYPTAIYLAPDNSNLYDGEDQIHLYLEGLLYPDLPSSIFVKTEIKINRVQANQILTALYLVLTGKKAEKGVLPDDAQYITFTKKELEEGNPIALIEQYDSYEARALAEYDSQVSLG
jgi:hypothetical protein